MLVHVLYCVPYYSVLGKYCLTTCFFGMVGGMLPYNLCDAVKCNTSLISKSSWMWIVRIDMILQLSDGKNHKNNLFTQNIM